MYIKIYSKDNCPFCDKAAFEAIRFGGFLREKVHPDVNPYPNFDYRIYKLGDDFDMKDLIEIFPTARTFPQISIEFDNGVRKEIGGYDQLVPFLELERGQLEKIMVAVENGTYKPQ